MEPERDAGGVVLRDEDGRAGGSGVRARAVGAAGSAAAGTAGSAGPGSSRRRSGAVSVAAASVNRNAQQNAAASQGSVTVMHVLRTLGVLVCVFLLGAGALVTFGSKVMGRDTWNLVAGFWLAFWLTMFGVTLAMLLRIVIGKALDPAASGGTGRGAQQANRPLGMGLAERLIARRVASIADPERRGYALQAHRLMFLDRDFNDQDYEMLLELDNNNQSFKRFLEGASQDAVECLPSYVFDTAKHRPAPQSSTSDGTALARDSTESGASLNSSRFECPICLDEYEDGQLIRILPCLHQFHAGCVDRALMEKAKCPMCALNIQSAFDEQAIVNAST